MKEFILNTIINENLLQNLFEGVVIVNSEQKIKFWNNEAMFITGYSFDEVKDKNHYDVLKHYIRYKKEIKTLFSPAKLALEKKICVAKEAFILDRKGKMISVRVHAIPMFSEKGDVDGAIEFLVLDSDYLMLIDKNKQLEALNRKKSLFIGMAAHDLKNPLTLIKGLSIIILKVFKHELSNEVITMIKRINCNCDKMTKLIDYYLNVSNIEMGKIHLNKVNVHLNTFFNLENYSFISLAKQKNINIQINIDPNLPEIKLDPDKITQVIENLVCNAIKFSNENTTITLNVEKQEGEILISIIDNGEGIDQNDLKMIFEPFETVTKHKEGRKSTGLGLAIVKQIIDLHAGTIDVSSVKSKGSIFKIRLPLCETKQLTKT